MTNTPKTAREALDRMIPLPEGCAPVSVHFNKPHIDAILTALAPFLKAFGTVEVCSNYERLSCKHNFIDQQRECLFDDCPLKGAQP